MHVIRAEVNVSCLDGDRAAITLEATCHELVGFLIPTKANQPPPDLRYFKGK